jgi:hypothetical protein
MQSVIEDALKQYTGGVEEAKEEDSQQQQSHALRNRESMESSEKANTSSSKYNNTQQNEKGLRAQLEEFILGSCGSVVEGLGCRWTDVTATNNNNNNNNHASNFHPQLRHQQEQPLPPARPALSIAEELQRLAAQEMPVFQPRAPDIPKFLGEDAVYSWDDDNVSAISQHTLEEMARKGLVHPMCQSNGSNGSNTPSKSSNSSSKENQAHL